MILDDVDARPGSATSLLLTIIGSYLRGAGGWFSTAELVRLLEAVGISGAHSRTAISRVKSKGVIFPERIDGQPGYRLHPDAVPMLERGDRRNSSFRQQRDGGPWCLISFSLPETERAARHQLRKRLAWIGCGTVTTGLWICPAFLTDEVEDILTELRLRHRSTLFITDTPQPGGALRDAVKQWWDLDAIASLHQQFVEEFISWGPIEDPRRAFARYVTILDRWRPITYLDPGLQRAVLPADWPGIESVELFERLRYELWPVASLFVRS